MSLKLPAITISNRSQDQWQSMCDQHVLSARVLENQDAFLCLWQQSQFCAQQCMQHPEWMDELLAITLAKPKNFHALYKQSLLDAVNKDDDEELYKSKLRVFRNKAMLFICWQDLILQAEVSQILLVLSQLADVCVEITLDWLQAGLLKKFGEPMIDSHQHAHLAMVALGKLGGSELNFSSDIDVMFFYTDNGYTNGARSISNQEFFTLVAQKFIRIFSDITAEGFVFRVDCRLRPFGDSGPLVVNCNHLEDYYLTHGREWERYALIKARVIYGSEKDKQTFYQIASSFVYRRYLDYGVIDTLRSMHTMIAEQVKSRGYENHVKLGIGGIREVEFIVQFFQLIRGGSNADLQTNSLLLALQEIEHAQYLEKAEVHDLTSAYLFLRRIENHIQMYQDQQTHELPADKQVMQVLSESMGYAEVTTFVEKLHIHTKRVAQLFAGISSNNQQKDENEFVHIWRQLLIKANDHLLEISSPASFGEWDMVCSRLLDVLNSPAYHSQDDVSRERLHIFMPIFLARLQKNKSPGLVFERMADLLSKMLRRSGYLVFLSENLEVLDQLIAVVEVSPWIANHITSYPVLMDELTQSGVDKTALTVAELQLGFNDQILQSPVQDYEHILERVRIYKHSHELQVACADIQEKLPIMKVSDQLSWLAEAVINGCLDYLQYQTNQQPSQLAVIAFGKLGGIELSYGSDLDLVYVGEDSGDVVQTARLAQKLTQMLSLQTVSGRLYEVDTRLRPDGSAGPIAPSFAYLQKYYQTRAWMWELQALVRARCIAGPQHLWQEFAKMRRDLLMQPRELPTLAQQVSEMRSKMLSVKKSKLAGKFDLKNDEGGITDIEFMIQYAVLAHAHKEIAICEYSDNVRILGQLAEHGYLSVTTASELDEIYCRYRAQTHRLALQADKAQVDQEKYARERTIVRNHWRELIESKIG